MKFKVTVTTVKEFETTMGDYPDCDTEEQVLKMEQEAAEDDPFVSSEGGETTVKVERVD